MVPPVPELQPAADAAGETRGRMFLSTEWRDLLMLNYEIDPALLQPFLPRGTELDSFEGETYVSLVGLRFARTKLFGSISVPFHSNFDEVNLRIYVRRREGSETRRGVMFIREIVSLPAVTFLAPGIRGKLQDAAASSLDRSQQFRRFHRIQLGSEAPTVSPARSNGRQPVSRGRRQP
jgi:hypothetical protein